MSWYITFNDVVNRYSSFASKVGAGATEAEGYILGAEAEVDASLVATYNVPFTPGSSNAPFLVRDICIDLAYWKAVAMFNKDTGPPLKEYIDARLKQLVDGTILLVSSGGLVAQGTPFAAATSDGVRSSFGVDPSENWSVSSAWQDSFVADREGD